MSPASSDATRDSSISDHKIPRARAHPASFRDPAGAVYLADGVLLRQVNRSHLSDYERLMQSGLYDELVEAHLLLPHEEVDAPALDPAHMARVLRPLRLSFVSHPYEWSFGQLQDAARLTLDIQKRAVSRGLGLKDASAYNVQFEGARPVFIDTLSFEPWEPGQPWSAYGQFCRHFLAPLALMSRVDIRLGRLLRSNIDGIPLDLAAKLLPRRSWLNPGLALHLLAHARAQSQATRAQQAHPGRQSSNTSRARGFSLQAMLGLLDSLDRAVRGLRWTPSGTTWADYYADAESYVPAAFQAKVEVVSRFLDHAEPAAVWDLGANDGTFSRLASRRGIPTVSLDLDPACVERNYRAAREAEDLNLLPLCMDLADPSPSLGWMTAERDSIFDRGPADTVLALALVHHLAIAGNVPLPGVAAFFARVCRRWLVIEFVPPDDPQTKRLISARRGETHSYNEAAFLEAFAADFDVERAERLTDSGRSLYLMRRVEER